MSSFVISKRDYVRVAGVVSGIAAAVNTGMSDKMWIYSHEKNRNMIASDYWEQFVKCYELNVESVCKQYSHHKDDFSNPDTYKDENDYMDDFVKYGRYGKNAVMTSYISDGVLVDLFMLGQKIIRFSESVLYQIEDESCQTIVREWFNTVITKIMKLANVNDDDRCDDWGSFDLNL